jgi:phosphoribosylformylglycinamidine synthase
VVDDVDVEGFAGYLEALAAQRALLVSGSPVAAGGVAARLVRGALATGLGADLVPAMGAAELFAEHRGGALVQVRPDDVPRLPAALHPTVVGTLTEAPGIRVGGVDLLAGDVEKHWLGSFEERIA